MKDSKSPDTGFLTYKGYPLVRNGNTLYYGNAYDEFVIMIQIMKSEKVGNIPVATKLKVFKMLTDESLPADKRIAKSADKTGLYEALDIANIWLNRSAS